ncbi:hypothetical protein F2Q68_00044586 [Brassica cretica]|uniref:Uncharacterized protein n=1 Tax=Brassica cretica TaxID=69181 RepID=A0A8S9LIB0_BRACR|nr:hypothetical protein F2Q68_00044586 [Brassica cretica]
MDSSGARRRTAADRRVAWRGPADTTSGGGAWSTPAGAAILQMTRAASVDSDFDVVGGYGFVSTRGTR